MKKVLDSDLKPEMKYEYYVENLPSAEDAIGDDGLVYTEVIMHPDDAAALHAAEGQHVQYANEGGQSSEVVIDHGVRLEETQDVKEGEDGRTYVLVVSDIAGQPVELRSSIPF